jgi:hypothetical protein
MSINSAPSLADNADSDSQFLSNSQDSKHPRNTLFDTSNSIDSISSSKTPSSPASSSASSSSSYKAPAVAGSTSNNAPLFISDDNSGSQHQNKNNSPTEIDTTATSINANQHAVLLGSLDGGMGVALKPEAGMDGGMGTQLVSDAVLSSSGGMIDGIGTGMGAQFVPDAALLSSYGGGMGTGMGAQMELLEWEFDTLAALLPSSGTGTMLDGMENGEWGEASSDTEGKPFVPAKSPAPVGHPSAPLPPFSVILRGKSGDTEWKSSGLLPPGLNSTPLYPVDLHSFPLIEKGAPPPISNIPFFTYDNNDRFVLVCPAPGNYAGDYE